MPMEDSTTEYITGEWTFNSKWFPTLWASCKKFVFLLKKAIFIAQMAKYTVYYTV